MGLPLTAVRCEADGIERTLDTMRGQGCALDGQSFAVLAFTTHPMLTLFNQRWRDGRASYRPAGETIDTRRYEVAPIDGDAEARAFVERHHYTASYPAARFRFGLYSRLHDDRTEVPRPEAVRAVRAGPLRHVRDDGDEPEGRDVRPLPDARLVGVAVFSVPVNDRSITNVFPVHPLEATDLGRFVLLDGVPANGETWFLARCFELLRVAGIRGLISMADPAAGHVGTIYQAHNAVYLGRATPRTLHVLPDGTVFNDRAQQKVRDGRGTRGFDYACGLLTRSGAPDPGDGDAGAWLREWRGRLCRRARHRGNHKYAWPIDRRLRRHLPASEPYPKVPDPRPVT